MAKRKLNLPVESIVVALDVPVVSNQVINKENQMNENTNANINVLETVAGLGHKLGLSFFRTNLDDSGKIWKVEVVSNLDATTPWLMKECKFADENDPNRDTKMMKNVLIIDEMKAAISAGMELHLQQFFVSEVGCHILAGLSDRPEGFAGYVAAWNRNPKFAHLTPNAGWLEIKYRNVAGNITYSAGTYANDYASTKHDYMDMLIAKQVNFSCKIPDSLREPKLMKDGTLGDSWINVIFQQSQMSQEQARSDFREHKVKFAINRDVNDSVRSTPATNQPTDVNSLVVTDVNGQEIDLMTVGDTFIYVYTSVIFLALIPWDKSASAIRTVTQYMKKGMRFSVGTKAG